MPQRFDVISPAGFQAIVGVDRDVTYGPRQLFVVAEGDVLTRFGVFESFREAEVQNVDLVFVLLGVELRLGLDAEQEVVWFDVPVYEVEFVHLLHTLEQTQGQTSHRFE